MNLRSAEFVRSLVASCERKRYAARAVIITQGQVSRDLFVLIDGSVSLRLQTPSGRELVLALMHAGGLFGEAGLFDTDAASESSVRAKSSCDVARISHAYLRAHPTLLSGVLRLLAPQLALRLHKLAGKAAQMAFCETEPRVAHALRELAAAPDARPHGDGSAVLVTRVELASMAGASREVVGRVLKRLQEQGMIRVNGRLIVVLPTEASAARSIPTRGASDYVSMATPSHG